MGKKGRYYRSKQPSQITAIPLPLNSFVSFHFYDYDLTGSMYGGTIDAISNITGSRILASSNKGVFEFIKNYSGTKQGGQLKVSIEFDIETK